jgi:hypothetical protein
MATQWPHVKAWLVATVPTLPGLSDVLVSSGEPTWGDTPARYVTVGFVTDDHGGQYQQVQTDDGTVWEESGEIRSQIIAGSGDTDPIGNEIAAFAIADALDAAIRADRTLGGTLSREGTSASAVTVLSVANSDGTATALVHSLHYTTVT